MVLAVAKPITVPQPAEAPSQTGKATTSRKLCPRCGTTLMFGYEDLKCVACGYVDPDSIAVISSREQRSLISTATRFVVRYVGDSPNLADTLTYVQLRRHNNRAVHGVRCPFCSGSMEQSSLSGKRKVASEERYRCKLEHRISLVPVPGKEGTLGWK